MEFLALIAFIIIVIWLWVRSRSDNPAESGSRAEQIFIDNEAWLKERWQLIDSSTEEFVDGWYFDEPTEFQLKRLEEYGLLLTDKSLTKGQVSDLIGLYVKPDEHEAEILKFFKIPLKGLNQTQARHQISLLFQGADNKLQWDNRPASAIEKEFYRLFGKPVPKNLTHLQALKDQNEAELSEEEDDEWDYFCSVWEELCDRETREDYELKKPSLAKYRTAWNAAKQEADSIDELSDPGLIAEKLIELYPDLQRD